jgi:glycosyltransferase involved in cell wall biosynthesis
VTEPLRILDLGIHDGSIARWVAEQLDAGDRDVVVDGLELNPDTAAIARKRLGKYCGEVKVADARQAAFQFPWDSYDAVVCFEIIEHVPDPGHLLKIAEKMAKPVTGRVYVSTPDGVFGEGSNPNHLRVYRALDLAELLRRRGDLQDMTVGEDGITAVSYIPCERRGEIAIYTGAGWQEWSPVDIGRKGLGGSETAAAQVAEQLSKLGFIVTVYGGVEEGCYRNVVYRSHLAFDPTERREAVISSRIPELFDRQLNCRTRMLWMHDTDCADRLTPARAEPIDHVLCLSRWHDRHLRGMYPFIADKLRRIRNGVVPELYAAAEGEERKQRLVYTSSPDRGLDVLLELWPRIREQVPDAVFAHCYTAVYDAIAEQQPALRDFRDKIARLDEQDGVQVLPALPQPELARLMRTSLVWAHPSWSGPADQVFNETFCIGAVEAQAAGCVVVASEWGALKETVKIGRLVGGEAMSDRWKDGLVAEIVDGLTSEQTQRWAQAEGPPAVADMRWDGVAEQLRALIDGETFAFEQPLEGAPA